MTTLFCFAAVDIAVPLLVLVAGVALPEPRRRPHLLARRLLGSVGLLPLGERRSRRGDDGRGDLGAHLLGPLSRGLLGSACALA